MRESADIAAAAQVFLEVLMLMHCTEIRSTRSVRLSLKKGTDLENRPAATRLAGAILSPLMYPLVVLCNEKGCSTDPQRGKT
jgi:hypothetical protein